MNPVTVTTDTRILEKMLSRLQPRAAEVVKGAAFKVQARTAIAAPYDTGALSNSIAAEQESPLGWLVRDGVTYGVFNELGTSRMGARPFMAPSVEAERVPFSIAFRALFYA